jgi:hypothetical protein
MWARHRVKGPSNLPSFSQPGRRSRDWPRGWAVLTLGATDFRFGSMLLKKWVRRLALCYRVILIRLRRARRLGFAAARLAAASTFCAGSRAPGSVLTRLDFGSGKVSRESQAASCVAARREQPLCENADLFVGSWPELSAIGLRIQILSTVFIPPIQPLLYCKAR